MTINEIKKQCIYILKQKNIEDGALKAKVIIANALKVNKEYLITHDNEELEEKIVNKTIQDINELILGQPIQYITKNQEFYGLNFYVDKNVLIPQPDTETLVEEVINIAKKIEEPQILDLCTGSGAIAISIKKNIQKARLTASDISNKALEVAKINKEKNNVEIDLIESDIFKNINQKFNIIVSNPPYIKTDVIYTLDKEVQKEPKIALDGGQDGLYFYRIIINEAYKYLDDNGYLCLEIGYNQKEDVINLIEKSGKYNNIYSKKDLAGNDRIIICNKLVR